MAFTNNRLDFYNNRTYDELTHAQALAKGCPNFVNKGLELTGTTLTSGVFVNGGTFGQLGNEGETHEITPNYTGYVIVKSTLNGSSSTSVVELDTTRNDTDPRDTGGVKYFTIYKLNAGVIEEDYRHSNYIKEISFENVGGSFFVQNINGTKSNPFDASTFAGNRTLINDVDIDYNDVEHSTTLIQDNLLDLFNKGQANVGNDKPFILSFSTASTPNFLAKLHELILMKNGCKVLDVDGTFTMSVATNNGVSVSTKKNTIFCTYETIGEKFLFMFDYDFFHEVIVTDEKIDFVALQAKNAGNFVRKLTETSDNVIINMIGDSLTRGYDIVSGTDEIYTDDNGESKTTKVVSTSIPERIMTTLNTTHDNAFTVINSGWSGDTANGSANRWFLDKNEDLTTIMLGTNDDSGNVPFDEYYRDIEIQIKRRLTFGSAVVLLIPPYRLERNGLIFGYKECLNKLSEKYGLPLIDCEEVGSQFDYTAYSDATHFNQLGYNHMGWKLSTPFINGIIFSKYQTISSGDTISFYRGEHSFVTNGSEVLADNYPTKPLDDASIGVNIRSAKAISLAAGEFLYLPVFLEQKNMLCVPQIYASPFGAGAVNVTRGSFTLESVDNAYNYVDNTGSNQENPPFNMYPRYTSPIDPTFLNYRSNTVFCLRGCIITNTVQGKMINFPSRGWNLIRITNDTDAGVTIHAIDFIGQYEYYGLTGQPPVGYSSEALLSEGGND